MRAKARVIRGKASCKVGRVKGSWSGLETSPCEGVVLWQTVCILHIERLCLCRTTGLCSCYVHRAHRYESRKVFVKFTRRSATRVSINMGLMLQDVS